MNCNLLRNLSNCKQTRVCPGIYWCWLQLMGKLASALVSISDSVLVQGTVYRQVFVQINRPVSLHLAFPPTRKVEWIVNVCVGHRQRMTWFGGGGDGVMTSLTLWCVQAGRWYRHPCKAFDYLRQCLEGLFILSRFHCMY